MTCIVVVVDHNGCLILDVRVSVLIKCLLVRLLGFPFSVSALSRTIGVQQRFLNLDLNF